jgi:hypothetical protein
VQLTVTGASGSVTWCGETWNLPADSGDTRCVCPGTWVEPAGTVNKAQWIASGLKMYHSTLFGFLAGRKNSLSPTNFASPVASTCIGSQSNCSATSSGAFAGSPIRGCLPKVNPTAAVSTSPAMIEDCQFFSHTQSGITYTWARGINWP